MYQQEDEEAPQIISLLDHGGVFFNGIDWWAEVDPIQKKNVSDWVHLYTYLNAYLIRETAFSWMGRRINDGGGLVENSKQGHPVLRILIKSIPRLPFTEEWGFRLYLGFYNHNIQQND